MSEQIIVKICTRCGEKKEATLEFFPTCVRYQRLDSWCRECYRKRAAAWSAKNPERKAARNKAWRESEGAQYKARRQAQRRGRSLSKKQYDKEKARRHNEKLKREAMEHYGGAICRCCGETALVMLSLDHVQGNGSAHRKELTGDSRRMPNGTYRWAKKNGWPPIFETMCFNCNWGRHWNDGICPHKLELDQLWSDLLSNAAVIEQSKAA